ncbi:MULTISPECIES: ABC transporter permease [Bacillaceae]|uniref:ABC transporter permease n=1 Tax=Bacillaceae TaxID=186817 RepID=UPI000BFC384E|nr:MULTISPECIES: ABC transporter permease [Bacillaceae]MCM3160611.1 ABC transporter permease [Metabacillus litoralis]PGT89766.1 glutathione ABC transporter permease GsiC [Bacillus sp. AFS040349]UGB31986.1 ABC transporter permease [Metabacillus sp. B2-18]
MASYIIKRLVSLVPVLIGVTILVFSIMHLSPGDPAKIMLGPKATEESIKALNAQLGLDQPLYVQYFSWIGNVLTGDWGRSLQMKMEVLPLVMDRFNATLILTFFSAILAAVIGIGVGIVSAYRKYSWIDRGLMLFVLFGFCLPVFWLGLILQIIFGLKLNILPMSGMYSPGTTGFADLFMHIILPSLALSAGAGAVIARMTRSSMLEVFEQDYIRTARSKGITERKVVYVHALKNAFIPVLTVLGMQIGYLLAGAVLVEMVFSWPGIGTLMINGILARDFPLVQGIILFVASTYVLINLIVDILYALLDPRISYR